MYSKLTYRRSALERHAPWAHRRHARLAPPSDLHGRPSEIRPIRINGQPAWIAIVHEPGTAPAELPAAKSMLPQLRRRVSAEIARYRAQGLLSDVELWIVEQLWRHGKSLRWAARQLGKDPQLVSYWIQRMEYLAPRFWLYWRLKNRNRSRR